MQRRMPPLLILRTAPKYDDVGRGEGDNMAGGSGEVTKPMPYIDVDEKDIN